MEKQIQTLTSELNYLKNNQNNVKTFTTENNSQQQSQTRPSLPSMPSPHKLQILQRNENTSSVTPKNGVNASVQNRGMTNKDLNQGSTTDIPCVLAYTYFYRSLHDFGHAYVDKYAHFSHMIF